MVRKIKRICKKKFKKNEFVFVIRNRHIYQTLLYDYNLFIIPHVLIFILFSGKDSVRLKNAAKFRASCSLQQVYCKNAGILCMMLYTSRIYNALIFKTA